MLFFEPRCIFMHTCMYFQDMYSTAYRVPQVSKHLTYKRLIHKLKSYNIVEMCGNWFFFSINSHFIDFIPISIWYLNPIPIFPSCQFLIPSHSYPELERDIVLCTTQLTLLLE